MSDLPIGGIDYGGGSDSGGPGRGLFGGVKFGNIFGLGGAITSLAGGFTAASGAIDAGNAKARAYADNALSAGTTAANTWKSLTRSQQEADYLANRLVGKQRALYAAGGVAATAGSPLDMLGDTQEQLRFAAMNRFYQGQEAGETASQQATYDMEAAAAAKRAAKTNATSDILGGIGNAVGSLGKMFSFPF